MLIVLPPISIRADQALPPNDTSMTHTPTNSFTRLCRQLGARQSMGRVWACFDNAAAEAIFNSLECTGRPFGDRSGVCR